MEGKSEEPRRKIDTGLWALSQVARYHRLSLDPQTIAHELALGKRSSTGADIVRAAQMSGLKAKLLSKQPLGRLLTVPRPAILRLNDGRYAVLRVLDGGRDGLVFARSQGPLPVTSDLLSKAWNGEIILIARDEIPADRTDLAFGLRWFTDTIWKYRRPLGHVFFTSIFIQVFALATPLLFQVVIDKVLVHRSISTLIVVALSMAIIAVFDGILQYLRTYTLTHTSNRIDVDLGSALFKRLLSLPLSYFETRPVGQTVARIRELETIRGFLTGQGLTSIIDLFFTFIYFAVLFAYSIELSFVVFITIPFYILVGAIIRPILRSRIQEKFSRGAASQQFLVESVVGAATLKAAAVEPFAQEEWEDRLAAYVRSAFRAQMLGAVGQSSITFLTRISTILVIFFGAQEVMNGSMTIGALIAFNMIASQMTQPVLRLAGLWQDFQQIQISINRIGDILNQAPEPKGVKLSARLPDLRGEISFQNVFYRYPQGARPVLENVSFNIDAGDIIGVVGASGSGKSTLTKLLQRLYLPENGQILIDGQDIVQISPIWLRRQIGVVLQENLLFNRTVHENIALTAPSMSRDQVVSVSRLAGADEFISTLPHGYDTMIVERGANLSGGQRQRVAIARALARNPRILIFDEATSALDYESEKIIQDNMREISRGRTVIIISHRLATVRDCHRIFGMERGRLIETGSHEDLLALSDGVYAKLWRLQSPTNSSMGVS